MLVKLTDSKGTDVWINPVHVRLVRRKGRHTEVFVPFNANWGAVSIKTRQPLDEVADLLNAGMPDLLGFAPDDDGTNSAAAAAAMAG